MSWDGVERRCSKRAAWPFQPMPVIMKIFHAVALAAMISGAAFVVRHSADMAASLAWQTGAQHRLDRIEDKLDRLISGGR